VIKFRSLTVVASFVLATTSASSAEAHAQLAVASPAPGAIVHSSPTRVALTFDDSLIAQDGANQITVTDVSGAHYERSVTLKAATLSASIKTLKHFGRYRVTYRVLSADGHVVSAQYSFYFRKKLQTG